MLQGSYSYPLVFVSLLIASLASYTTLDLAGRISRLHNQRHRQYWLLGGAAAMGLGIWSMHFIGMLAFSLPIPLGYDIAITLLSLAIAILVSYFALDQVTRGELTRPLLLKSGVLMGLGIIAMHYSGMAAMRMTPAIQYSVPLVLLSIAIAIAASSVALWIASTLRLDRYGHLKLRRAGAAVVMGLAITGLHYTGMAAASFPLGSICGAALDLHPKWLAVIVVVTTVNFLAITLILSILDTRLEMRTRLYDDSIKNANETLQYQATHDAVTGLPNRYLLSERIQAAIRTSTRNKTRLALYFIDLDGFKIINDSLGHSVGDQLLRAIAARLTLTVRKEDVVARLGGDEFVVLTGNIEDAAIATQIAEKLFHCFKQEFELIDTSLRISASIGVSLFPDNGNSIDALLKHADTAMYEVKTGGRNNYRFFQAEMSVANRRTIQIQGGLRAAIPNGEMFVQYQPKWDCDGNAILGAEALVRWQHPELGMISPAEFIPIAERSGHIMEIDHWVVEEVCRQQREWKRGGIVPVKIAVNLSQINFRSSTLVEDLAQLADRYGVARNLLMFEITETVAMQNAEETMKTIVKLQNAGFDLAIDDFGTGYSSLSYLQQFSVRQLKVDRMFVNNLSRDDQKGTSVVAAIITLAHSLNMEVVAEGVETEDQMALLDAMACDQMQGFLLGKPMESSEFTRLLANSKATLSDAGQ